MVVFKKKNSCAGATGARTNGCQYFTAFLYLCYVTVDTAKWIQNMITTNETMICETLKHFSRQRQLWNHLVSCFHKEL